MYTVKLFTKWNKDYAIPVESLALAYLLADMAAHSNIRCEVWDELGRVDYDDSANTSAVTLTASGHDFAEDDHIAGWLFPRPWWLRLWHWVIRKPPPIHRISSTTRTKFDLRG